MKELLSFQVKKFNITLMELEGGLIGFIIESPKVKTYIPPLVNKDIKLKLPKYLLEKLEFLKELQEVK